MGKRLTVILVPIKSREHLLSSYVEYAYSGIKNMGTRVKCTLFDGGFSSIAPSNISPKNQGYRYILHFTPNAQPIELTT
jgi:hypothetical protein